MSTIKNGKGSKPEGSVDWDKFFSSVIWDTDMKVDETQPQTSSDTALSGHTEYEH